MAPTSQIFQLRNLSCSYNLKVEDRVLHIESLDIHRGKLIFLLGASGSGKSTLLETLGLMNDTIAEGEVLFKTTESEYIDLHKLWENEDSNRIAELRKKHFSFIFQNTNLMENFSAIENICVSPMIQKGVTQAIASDGARQLMIDVGLSENQVAVNTLSANLSGGQRQRLAFVRALLSDYSVLLCDEPTGNLDEANSRNLIRLIRDSIGEQKTAIIVSHDINLALEFADVIVCLSESSDGAYSEVVPQHIFSIDKWKSMNHNDLLTFKQYVVSIFEHTTEHKRSQELNTVANSSDSKVKFNSLFFQKEGRELDGKGRVNFTILTALLLITFLAIGFANGSLLYVKQKLDSSFVNWLTLNIPHEHRSLTKDIVAELKGRGGLKEQFKISTVTDYREARIPFLNQQDSSNRYIKTRVFEDGDPLLNDILSKENIVIGDSIFESYQDFGVILTERFLNELGYNSSDAFVFMYQREYDFVPIDTLGNTEELVVQLHVPIPVRAIVKEMPGKYQTGITDYFFNCREEVFKNTFDSRKKSTIDLFVEGDKLHAESIQNQIEAIIQGDSLFKKMACSSTSLNEHSASFHAGFDIQISFCADSVSHTLRDQLLNYILINEDIGDKVIRFYDYNRDANQPSGTSSSASTISIHLTSLDSVRSLSEYILKNYNNAGGTKGRSKANESDMSDPIELDMSKVLDKENFNYMSKIATIICWLVILFASVCVSLFISNLLKTHLNKVKMNIGTFTAFGLPNGEARKIYFLIILRFVFWSLLIAFLLAFCIGWCLNGYLHSTRMLDGTANYFVLLHINTYVLTGVILASTILVSFLTIKRILSKSPGDLIYNR